MFAVFESCNCSSVNHGLLLVTTGVAVAPPPPVGLTVSATVAVRTVEADVPVIVMLVVPVAAVLDALNIIVELLPVVLFGVKLAVTPLGRPLAVRVTAPGKLVRE